MSGERGNDQPGAHRWRLFAAAIVVLGAVTAYHNSFQVPELFDDPYALSANPTIRHLWPPWVAFSPPAASGVGGRPIANLSFALNHAWSGTDLRSYHVVNLCIHIGASLLLLGVARRTLRRPATCPRDEQTNPWRPAQPEFIALAIALLWAVHPTLTIAVTYLSQRTESLMGLFYLLTIYAFIRGTDGNRSSRTWLSVSVAACCAGMATKEVMVTAPVMVLLYDRTFVGGTFAAAFKARWRYYLGLASTWLLLAALMGTGLHDRSVGYGLGVEWWRYAATQCRSLVVYLRLGVWPDPLVFDYGRDFLSWPAAAPYACLIALAIAGTLVALQRRPVVGFGMSWFLVILAPTSSIVPLAYQPIGENRLYLSSIAVIAGMVIAAYVCAGRRGFAAFILAALAFVVLAERRNETYTSALALWRDTLTKAPNNTRAFDNYGQALLRQGRLDEALQQYRRALQINPASDSTHSLLGDAFAAGNRLEEAAAEYARAIELNPRHALYYNNLAAVFGRAGQRQLSAQYYAKAVELSPGFSYGHLNLANAFYDLGRFREAQPHFERALALGLDSPVLRQKLGLTLLQLGNPAEAARQLATAVQQQPADADARNNLGVALLQMRDLAGAAAQFTEALRLNPNHANARTNLEATRAATPATNPIAR